MGWCLTSTAQQAQTPATQKPAATDKSSAEPDEGIPIKSEVVLTACGSCHKADDKKRLSRISYRRTTPEGWQETLRRMVTLNKLQIEPDVARKVVKYLADNHGLAPEEVAPGTFELERRLIDYKYSANADTDRVCSSCHSMGRVILQRRSGRLGSARRDASRLVSARRLPGISPHGPTGTRAVRTAVHLTTVIRWTRCSTTCDRRFRSRRLNGRRGPPRCEAPGSTARGR
jgi:cytochrome c553